MYLFEEDDKSITPQLIKQNSNESELLQKYETSENSNQ